MGTLVQMCPESEKSSGPESAVPGQLRDVWLRFHERALCQDLDTVFVFHPKGMEVWCLVEDERSYQRFSDMLEPLRPAFEIEVYATRPSPEKKTKADDEPPPSLWNNDTLQNYLAEPSRSVTTQVQQEPDFRLSRHSVLKQRLLMWSSQILNWNKKVRRYAADLPDLARLGFGPGPDQEAKRRAVAVCLAHAQDLDKNLSRLSDNIAVALPRPERAARAKEKPATLRLPTSPAELVTIVSSRAQEVAESVYRFVYPQDHTVDLKDLKHSSLLEAFRELRKIISELQKAAGAGR